MKDSKDVLLVSKNLGISSKTIMISGLFNYHTICNKLIHRYCSHSNKQHPNFWEKIAGTRGRGGGRTNVSVNVTFQAKKSQAKEIKHSLQLKRIQVEVDDAQE